MSVAKRRLTGLDGIRALACLGVFVHHVSHTWGMSRSSLSHHALQLLSHGVGVFFVLSGFLLSLPFLRSLKLQRPMPDLHIYAVHRAARIVPAYCFCLLFCFLLLEQYSSQGLFTLLFALGFVNCFHYQTFFALDSNLAMWSISIEVWFYMIFAVWAWGLFRFRNRIPFAAYWMITLAILVAYHAVVTGIAEGAPTPPAPNDPVRVRLGATAFPDKNPFGQFAHFMFGILSAWLYLMADSRAGSAVKSPSTTRMRIMPDAIVIALMVFATIPAFITSLSSLPGLWRVGSMYRRATWAPLDYSWPLFPLTLALLMAALPFTRFIGPWLDNRFLSFTAKLSYGIYLWHMPVICVFVTIWPDMATASVGGKFLFSIGALASSYLIAMTTYFLFEHPINEYAIRRTSIAKGIVAGTTQTA